MIIKKATSLPAVVVSCASVLSAVGSVQADHPQVLVTPADRPAVQAKLEQAPWARQGYATVKARVDPYLALTEKDPKFVSSRLQMNWETHYTTPLVEKSKLVGGEGRAPVP